MGENSLEVGYNCEARSRAADRITRLDRLLARQLRILRTSLLEFYDSGRLRIFPAGKDALRKAAHTGQRILLSDSLPHEDSC